MALEFNKVTEQVERMGRMIGELDFEVGDRLQLARQRFFAASDLDFIHRRIALVRGPEVSGYRGAAPLDAPYHEPVCQVHPLPADPGSATIVASDGSQIYPSEQWRIPYYLTNVGLFVYYHGQERVPDHLTAPRLVYHPDHVRDKARRVLSNRTIDALRTVREMRELARLIWDLRSEARPLVALYDNRLLFWLASDVTGHRQIIERYQGALVHLRDAGALLAGYVDSPVRSRLVIRLLHLLSLSDDEVPQDELGTGDMEGLRDLDLFASVLQPGERSALMVQNSPHNLQYRRRGENYEIAFFYLKIASGFQEAIARVDVPLWVARDRAAVDALHALLVSQCSLQGRNPYPYALTRADELAVVSTRDKQKLDEMIRVAWRAHKPGVDPLIFSAKAWGKQLARSSQRQHEM